jgi:hypothetical protein
LRASFIKALASFSLRPFLLIIGRLVCEQLRLIAFSFLPLHPLHLFRRGFCCFYESITLEILPFDRSSLTDIFHFTSSNDHRARIHLITAQAHLMIVLCWPRLANNKRIET